MRQLTEAERAALTQPKNFELYLETVREMEGGVVYAIRPLTGTTPRALKVNLGRVAKQLDLRLHWFSPATDNGELVVELRS